MPQEDHLIETLEDAGYKATIIDHVPGRCERCGAVATELAYGGCFPCGMWEDPESDDKELKGGVSAALHMGLTLDMWVAGRRRWGRLVPSEKQITRIDAAIQEYIRETLQPWIDSHTTGKAGKEEAPG